MLESFSRQVDVAFGRCLSLLLKRVQYVDRIGQSSGIDNSINSGIISQANLFHAFADAGHGFEAAGLLAALHLFQLISGIVPSVFWKLANPFERVAEKPDRLHGPIILVWI